MFERSESLVPGARVFIHDEECLIRRVDPSTDGGHLLTCDGISELVRSRSTLYVALTRAKRDALLIKWK